MFGPTNTPQDCDCEICNSQGPAIAALMDIVTQSPEQTDNVSKVAAHILGLNDTVAIFKKALVLATKTISMLNDREMERKGFGSSFN